MQIVQESAYLQVTNGHCKGSAGVVAQEIEAQVELAYRPPPRGTGQRQPFLSQLELALLVAFAVFTCDRQAWPLLIYGRLRCCVSQPTIPAPRVWPLACPLLVYCR